MTQLAAATIRVIEHELNVLRGLRISQDTAVAEVAVKRERLREAELRELRAQLASEAVSIIPDDEEPLALAASAKPGAR